MYVEYQESHYALVLDVYVTDGINCGLFFGEGRKQGGKQESLLKNPWSWIKKSHKHNPHKWEADFVKTTLSLLCPTGHNFETGFEPMVKGLAGTTLPITELSIDKPAGSRSIILLL